MGWSPALVLCLIALCCFFSSVSGRLGKCDGAKTCSDCIKTHFSCKWCKDETYNSPRCTSDFYRDSENNKCVNWVFPESTMTPDNQDFTNLVQVKPMSIEITQLRPGEEKNVSVVVKSSRNYPLDVYYLMDFSYSMQGDLEQLIDLTEDITRSLQNVSTDYAIGFGTFVDKPTAPYANTYGDLLEKPCHSCQAVHSFNHEMKLTKPDPMNDLADTFKSRLQALEISSNVDNPEGGFDAMVQAAICEAIIGWRDPARKVIFFASDAVFHVAGDGKLAGIVTPNEGSCGMENNKYAKSLQQDYPSIGQINDILIRNQIIPIFAVTSQMQQLYQDLSDHLTQLSSVGMLGDNSERVAEIIQEQINKIVSSTQLNPQAPQGVTVTVKPVCQGNQELMSNGQGCSNVKVEEEVRFDVNIKVDECVEGKTEFEFPIEVPGIATIPIKVQMVCDCECEKPENGEIKPDAAQCNYVGDLICGACMCDEGNYGELCECNQNHEKDISKCRNNETLSICSGENNGKCICGQCVCIQPVRDEYRRWGDLCECSNYECPRNHLNELCSGNGECICGACDCKRHPNGAPKQKDDEEFTGDDCSCPVSTTDCVNPANGVECTGPQNGGCECGKCKCNANFLGPFCDICQDCGPLNCTQYETCVECMYEGRNEDDVTYKTCGCEIETMISNDEQVDTSKLGRHKQCSPIRYPDDDSKCDIIYYLHYRSAISSANHPTVIDIRIDRELDCPTQPNIIAIVAGVICGILAVGILLLILWKIYTTIIDKREYTKFLEERSKARWNTERNPLYKEPSTTYINPLTSPHIRQPPLYRPPPSRPPTEHLEKEEEVSRRNSSINNEKPRRYNTGDFSSREELELVEKKVLNTEGVTSSPAGVTSSPEGVTSSDVELEEAPLGFRDSEMDLASNLGELDDIMSTLSRDTVFTNPSAASYGAPTGAPPKLPPRDVTSSPASRVTSSPARTSRASPARPPRGVMTSPAGGVTSSDRDYDSGTDV